MVFISNRPCLTAYQSTGGDGTADETFPDSVVNTSHTYASDGAYCITLTVVNGGLWLHGDNDYAIYGSRKSGIDDSSSVRATNICEVIVGDKVKCTGNTFNTCRRLKSIVFNVDPEQYATADVDVGGNTFNGCSALKFVGFPNTITMLRGTVF